ncbi:hypothetical protein [Guillardia theta]|uniref:Uncharacterized protein n=1 Tax=Guillardia theta TaxID=55529 RepID=Q9AVY4_GUITH|nr:hypothetical protein GTHECHR2177 [Guillardia theta]CAC27087.1 hypothetical protein [Guillardia theta]
MNYCFYNNYHSIERRRSLKLSIKNKLYIISKIIKNLKLIEVIPCQNFCNYENLNSKYINLIKNIENIDLVNKLKINSSCKIVTFCFNENRYLTKMRQINKKYYWIYQKKLVHTFLFSSCSDSILQIQKTMVSYIILCNAFRNLIIINLKFSRIIDSLIEKLVGLSKFLMFFKYSFVKLMPIEESKTSKYYMLFNTLMRNYN